MEEDRKIYEALKKELSDRIGMLAKSVILEDITIKLSKYSRDNIQKTMKFEEELEKVRDEFYNGGFITEKISIYYEILKDIPRLFENIATWTFSDLKEIWAKNEKNCFSCRNMYKIRDGKNRPVNELVDKTKWCALYPELSGIKDEMFIKNCPCFNEYTSILNLSKKRKLEIVEKGINLEYTFNFKK